VVRADGTESAIGRFPQPYVARPGEADLGDGDCSDDDDDE